MPFQPVPIPALGLSEGDKQCIRDRSCIMARHILADQPEEYIQAQVNIQFLTFVTMELALDHTTCSQYLFLSFYPH